LAGINFKISDRFYDHLKIKRTMIFFNVFVETIVIMDHTDYFPPVEKIFYEDKWPFLWHRRALRDEDGTIKIVTLVAEVRHEVRTGKCW
jgi:hypothetical protein